MTDSLLDELELNEFSGFVGALEEAVDQAGSGFMVMVPEGPSALRIIHVSRGTAQMLATKPEELCGKMLLDLVPPDEFEKTLDRIRERNRGGALPTLMRTALRRSDGTSVQIDVGTNRLRIKGREVVISFVHDITDRMRAEDELRRSEARFRTVVEHSPDGVAILRDRKISYLNPIATRMLGFEPGQGIGSDIASVLIPEHSALAKERIAETMRIGRSLPAPAEYTVANSGDPPRTCEVVSVPLEFEGGPAVLGFARDITERKAIHEKLARADRLATIGALAGAIAHEINNPLACVLMSVESLERELIAARLPQLAKHLREAKQNIGRIERIVRSLGSNIDSDPDTRGPVEVRGALEQAIRLCENEIRHRARLVRSYAAVPPTFGNRGRLEQVLIHLILSAAHAFEISNLEENQIRIALSTLDDGRISIEITDNGPGSPRELAISRQIIENFGGTIDVSSSESGTTAHIRLPPHGEWQRPEPSPSGKGRRTVLLIDDEPVLRALFSKLLEPHHEVVTTDSAFAAMAILDERSDFDTILLDVMMPGMNGQQLYEIVKSRWPGLDRRIAFITGGVFDPVLSRFLAEVANPKLLKPFQLADVLAVIDGMS